MLVTFVAFGKEDDCGQTKGRNSAPTHRHKVLLADSAQKLWLCSLGLLNKLGSSGSSGQLLQQQQTKIFNLVQSLIGGGAENQRKAGA